MWVLVESISIRVVASVGGVGGKGVDKSHTMCSEGDADGHVYGFGVLSG